MPYASGRAFRALGEGLRGIGRTVGTLRREDEELRRREEEDRRRREREDLATELQYIDRGGGLGPPPDMERMVPGTRPELEFDAGELLPEPAPDGGVGLGMDTAERSGLLPTPDLSERGPLTLSEPDPRYAQVGRGYVERPGVAEDRARLERRGRISEGLGEILGPDAAPELTSGMSSLLVEGVNPSSLMPRQGPDVNWQTVTTADGRIVQVHPRTGQTRDTGLEGRVPSSGGYTPTQAQQFLDGLYGVYEPDATGTERLTDYVIPREEIYKLQQRMVRGEEVTFPPRPDLTPGQQQLLNEALAQIQPSGSGMDRLLPEPEPGAVPEPPLGGGAGFSTGPTDAEVQAAARALGDEGIARRQAEAILRSEGATEDQIRRALGGR